MDRSMLIVFAILLLIDMRRIQCRPHGNHHPIRACGAALTNILLETCPFGFNPYYRSDENQNIEQDNPSDDDNQTTEKLGLNDECCAKPCTRANILEYCNNKPDVTIQQSHDSELTTSTSRTDVKLSMKNNEIVEVEKTNELIENKTVKTKPVLGNADKPNGHVPQKTWKTSSHTEDGVTKSTTENLRHVKTTKPTTTRPPKTTKTTRAISKITIDLFNTKKS